MYVPLKRLLFTISRGTSTVCGNLLNIYTVYEMLLEQFKDFFQKQEKTIWSWMHCGQIYLERTHSKTASQFFTEVHFSLQMLAIVFHTLHTAPTWNCVSALLSVWVLSGHLWYQKMPHNSTKYNTGSWDYYLILLNTYCKIETPVLCQHLRQTHLS
jgi:hypothetical protein